MKNDKNKKIHHLGLKVNVVVAALLIVSIVVVLQVCVSMFRSLTMDMLENECVNANSVLESQLMEIVESGASVDSEDITLLLDELKEDLGCEFTIFNGDVRAYTTILQDGKRAVGTKLSEKLAAIVLEQGKSYVGEAQILGVDHVCSYIPTKDENGKVNGLLFAGISMQNATGQINKTINTVIIVGGILVVVGLILLSAYIRHRVSKPLSRLTELAQTMERGDLGIKSKKMVINIHSNDEVGFLAQTFENTMSRLNGYIGEISTVLDSISQGNLTVATNLEYIGDFASIKESLDDILDKLNNTMSQIIESSDSVSSGAEQMAIGATALSQGAVEQASSVEDLDRNIRDISDQVGNTAENAQQANKEVESVSERLIESNRKMQEMINAMQEINDRSNEIGKIIKTIENISAQTNILALNAAVEAARAGEAGKGFAVVAEEVRELASKSAEASQTTTALIERSIDAVEEGTRIANETASQLMEVVSGANEIVDVTNKIADAARSQADSVFLIKEQISQISNVVQTNSATAQQSAATSQELSQQAGVLKDLMRTFRLNTRYLN
ncbi:MAG: cache domain-containing protein [Lachnospiraceae bacterium]|nr:cache domain-containing protein [Lachnospiraceae bacterium]